MHSNQNAALIVLNYNSCSFLSDCLTSLINQTYPYAQIIVVDNQSTDDSVEYIASNFPQVKLIVNPANYGFGKGFNQGIRAVWDDFEYIGLFNADVRLEPTWLAECIQTLQTESNAYICSSLVLTWDGQEIDNAGGQIIDFTTGIFGHFLGKSAYVNFPEEYRQQAFPVFFGVANAVLLKTDTFRQFGLFAEDFFMYYEDVDLSWRVLLGGGRIYCNPKAIAYHYGHGAKRSQTLVLAELELSETNLLITYFQNLSLTTLVWLFPVLIPLRLLGALLYLPISPKITIGKMRGLINFIPGLRLHWSRRRSIQQQRVLTDRRVLLANPAPIFAWSQLGKLISITMSRVTRSYQAASRQSK